jgi:predicted RNA-binding protein with PUA-like domain
MAGRYWLIKSEPAAYGWDDLVKDGETVWDGVRNHRAASNLRAMQRGDWLFFYHSVTGKEIVGVAEVSEAGLADPKDGAWAAVKVRPVRALARPVTLAEIKADNALSGIELVRLSRLSVAEIRPAEWDRVLELTVAPAALSCSISTRQCSRRMPLRPFASTSAASNSAVLSTRRVQAPNAAPRAAKSGLARSVAATRPG